MTTKVTLHELVEQLRDDQADLARMWLEDLTNATGAGGLPLDAATLDSLDCGLADVAAGRVKPLSQYERERGM